MACTSENAISDSTAPLEVFMCPISREVMRDPVVLVETGQIYDKASIHGWFQRGRNTCPLTGISTLGDCRPSKGFDSAHSGDRGLTFALMEGCAPKLNFVTKQGETGHVKSSPVLSNSPSGGSCCRFRLYSVYR